MGLSLPFRALAESVPSMPRAVGLGEQRDEHGAQGLGPTIAGPDAAAIERLRALCESIRAPARDGAVATGFGPIDATLPRGGLDRGAVHEWVGIAEALRDAQCEHAQGSDPLEGAHASMVRSADHAWAPPHTIMIRLARRALASAEGGSARVVWVGRAVWPYPIALIGHAADGEPSGARDPARADAREALDASLFVHARTPPERVWATDLALRSRACAAVIADASGFDLSSTRRLQLAAEAGGGLCLLARPPNEMSELSAAATRWLIRSCPSPLTTRRWTVGLLRCKGLQPAPHAQRVWIVERDHATRTVGVVPDVRDGPGDEAASPERVRAG